MQTNFFRFSCFSLFLISFVFSLHAAEKTEADPESTYPLNIRVLMEQEGSEWLGSYDNRVEAFLWKKIDENGINDDTSPVIFAADGSVWRQVHSSRLYGKPSPYFQGVIDTKLSPGEYRASVANSKVYQKWEGPPGSRGGSRSGHQDYDTKVWHYEVSGFGGPQHVYGWVLGDPIRIDGGEEKYEQKIWDEGVPASFTVTTPKDEAEKLNLRLFREDGFYLENGRASGDYGLPSKMSFSRLPLGKYRLCVFRGKLQGNLLSPNTDVFPVEITTDGPNDFSFAAEKSLASESPWSVRGTVRDADGKPIKDVSIRADASFTGLHGDLTTQTDENGNYVLPITPLDVFSGIARNEETGLPAYGFRFQQLILSASRYPFVEKERSIQGDLLVVGDFAKPEEIDELKKRFAEEKFETVFVEKGKPLQIDFVLEPRLEKTWPETEDGIPPSFVYQSNLWTGKEKLDRRYEVYRKTVFSYTMNDAYKAAVELSDKISVSLRFPKPEILVGEPMKFDYVVRNNSDTDLWITVGGDYRGSGRPTSFTMRAIRTDGDEEKTVYEIPVTMNMGGISHEEKIPADGGEYAFKLCLACWLKLEEPGEYRIDVARYLGPSPQGGFPFVKSASTAPSVLRAASTKLTVKAPDHEAFGKLIDELGEQKEIDKLVHIEDERVIPWLLKLAEENDNYYVKSALAKFNDDRVLEVISRDIASNDDTKSHSAAVNLSRSKHPGAIDILLKHQDHPNYAVRLTVVQTARKMPKDVALRMLQRRFKDTGWEGRVGQEARRIYKEIKGDDPVEQRKEFDEKLQNDRKRYENMSPEELRDEIYWKQAFQIVVSEKMVFPTERSTANLLAHWLVLLKKDGKISAAEDALKEIVDIFEKRKNDPHIRDTDYPYETIAALNVELDHNLEARRLVLEIEGFLDKACALTRLGKRIGKAGDQNLAACIFEDATSYLLWTNDADDPHRERNPDFPKSRPLNEIAEGWAEIGMFEKAFETIRLIDDPYYAGESLRTIARFQHQAGLESEAEKTLQMPMIPLERTRTLLQLAHKKIEAEDFESARKLLDEAEALIPTIDRKDLCSYIIESLAEYYAKVGEIDKAKKLFAEIFEALPEGVKQPPTNGFEFSSMPLCNLLASQAHAGLFDDAMQTALLFPEGENRDAGIRRIASAYASHGKDTEAIEWIGPMKTRWERQWGLENIAKAQIEQGRLDSALETILMMQADDDKDFGYPDGRWTSAESSLQGECLGLLAEAHAKAGRYGEAAALVNRIVDTGKRLHAYRLIVDAMP